MISKFLRRYWANFNYWKLQSTYKKLSTNDSYEFIYNNSSHLTKIYKDQWNLRKSALESCPKDGAILEFGVFNGKSINFFAEILKKENDSRNIVGFDSFRGFSEDWAGVENKFPSSRFDRGGNQPPVDDNVLLVDGYIEETLPVFLSKQHDLKVSFIHIDTDTYSPAATVLSLLKPFLVEGSIIVFDELCGYPNWRSHEYRALVENFDRDEYEFLGFSVGSRRTNLMNASIKIVKPLS